MSTELQWRRRWKPDLRASPWKPMQIDGNTYLVKCRFAGESYELLLTDLTTMWVERLGEVTLKKRIKKLNPSLEAQTTKILDHIQSNIESPNFETTFSVGFHSGEGDGDAESVRLTVNSKLAGMPFLWHFDGSPVDRDVLSEHLTMPLLAMVGELFRRQQELIKVVTRKDKEIADYKAQGVKTSRKHIETLLFDETAFGHDMVTSQGFEEEVRQLGVGAFTEGGQHLYRDIMTKHAWVTRSPSAGDDTSDSLSDETSLDPAAPSSGSTSWGNNRLPPSLLQSTPSPRVSPQKSPGKSSTSTPETSPTKDTEMLRRQALEKRLLEEEAKKEIKARKKKKIGF